MVGNTAHARSRLAVVVDLVVSGRRGGSEGVAIISQVRLSMQ